MSEMVERVAKALQTKRDEILTSAGFPPDAGAILARSAIEAMKQPTKEMLHVGAEAYDGWAAMHKAWEAMINEALK